MAGDEETSCSKYLTTNVESSNSHSSFELAIPRSTIQPIVRSRSQILNLFKRATDNAKRELHIEPNTLKSQKSNSSKDNGNESKDFKPLLLNDESTSSGSSVESATLQITPKNTIRSRLGNRNSFKRTLKNSKPELDIKQSTTKPPINNYSKDEKDTNSAIINPNKIVFNVLIGKKSTRKHKIWDDDGTLEVTGKNALLKNADGKVLGRTNIDPATLEEGFRLSMDNKEVEIVDKVSHSITPAPDIKDEVVQEPPIKKQKILPRKGFVPLGLSRKESPPLIMPSISSAIECLDICLNKPEQEVSVDPCLANVLRPHQREGVLFLYKCVMGMQVPNYYGAILADEMGLGKTLQCITILWTLMRKGPYGQPVIKRALIVTPSSLCGNWDKEFSRWLGYYRISPFVIKAKNKPKDFKSQFRNPVMIISYDMLIRNFEEIEEITFDLMICDEGHRLKNNDIKVAKFLSSMNCKRRILLTGTPVQNDLQEFFALIDFVNPGILGTGQEYKGYYENPIVLSHCPHAAETVQLIGKERAAELYEKTKLFILRRTQDTINKYLPSKHEIIVFCTLSQEQETRYSRITDEWFSKSALPEHNVPHLTAITNLKKICNHPDLLDKENSELNIQNRTNYCGKVSIVQTLMRNLRKTDEKLVLISYFTQTLDLLGELCNRENFKFLRLDGSTSTKLRSKIVERFNQKTDDHKIFLLSGKAGGVGLNLPGASRLVLFDSDWNPASDTQAMARIWRDGQKKDVYIYRLLLTGTIEEKIFQRQISKSGLSETVVEAKSLASLKFSSAELKDLFTLTTNTDCVTHEMMKCTCNGWQSKKVISEDTHSDDFTAPEHILEDDVPKRNLTINQLLEWEHYKQPVPPNIMQEIMLEEISDRITFVFKNSVYQSRK